MLTEKILLITTDGTLKETIKDSFLGLNKDFPIIQVDDINEAIERIISNGFTMTILDLRSFNICDDFIGEVIKLNYVARKKLILITNENYTKKLKKIIPCDLSECLIVNLFGDKLKNKLQYFYVNKLSKSSTKTHKEIVENILGDIKTIKSSRLYKILKPITLFL